MENIKLGLHLTSRHWQRFSPEELECLECYVQETSQRIRSNDYNFSDFMHEKISTQKPGRSVCIVALSASIAALFWRTLTDIIYTFERIIYTLERV